MIRAKVFNKVGGYFQIPVPNIALNVLNIDFDARDSVIDRKKLQSYLLSTRSEFLL